MILKKKQRNPGFTIIDNQVIVRPEISAKAKGILLYIMSRPDNWDISTADIAAHMKEGQEAIRSGINELREYGYMRLDFVQNESGKMNGTIWNAADWPAFTSFDDCRVSENPKVGNHLSNNNTIITNKGRNKEGKAKKDLFGDEPEKKVAFEASPLADFEFFKKEIFAPGFESVDLKFYHGQVMDWSIKKDGKVKRTVRGWLATVRTFIRGDIQNKKLKTITAEADESKVDAALKFLGL